MGGDEEKLLRVNIAAGRMERSAQHVRRLVREKKIAFHRESPRKTLIPESAVEAFRGEHSENP